MSADAPETPPRAYASLWEDAQGALVVTLAPAVGRGSVNASQDARFVVYRDYSEDQGAVGDWRLLPEALFEKRYTRLSGMAAADDPDPQVRAQSLRRKRPTGVPPPTAAADAPAAAPSSPRGGRATRRSTKRTTEA